MPTRESALAELSNVFQMLAEEYSEKEFHFPPTPPKSFMPSATASEFQRVARRMGFSRTRQTGSHERWNHPDGRAVTIPLHGGRDWSASILQDSSTAKRKSGGVSEIEVAISGVKFCLLHMIPKECKRLTEVDFPVAEVSRHSAREKFMLHCSSRTCTCAMEETWNAADCTIWRREAF